MNITEKPKINHHAKCIIQYDAGNYSVTTITTAT